MLSEAISGQNAAGDKVSKVQRGLDQLEQVRIWTSAIRAALGEGRSRRHEGLGSPRANRLP